MLFIKLAFVKVRQRRNGRFQQGTTRYILSRFKIHPDSFCFTAYLWKMLSMPVTSRHIAI